MLEAWPSGTARIDDSSIFFATSALITMDTEGDFQRAILQSGTLARPFFLQGLEDDRVARVEEFGERVGCSAGDAMVECLRGKPVSELVAASAMFPAHTVWQPVIDSTLGENSILPLDPLSRFDFLSKTLSKILLSVSLREISEGSTFCSVQILGMVFLSLVATC